MDVFGGPPCFDRARWMVLEVPKLGRDGVSAEPPAAGLLGRDGFHALLDRRFAAFIIDVGRLEDAAWGCRTEVQRGYIPGMAGFCLEAVLMEVRLLLEIVTDLCCRSDGFSDMGRCSCPLR
ncbi:hypothetical protein ACLOJK_018588 [Asimina triloba]